MKRILALTKDGRMTYCSASEENRGKGRCNHVAHQNIGESTQDFINRINVILESKEKENPELIDVTYLKEGLNKLDKMMVDQNIDPITINVVGGFCTYDITNETTRDINSMQTLDNRIKNMVNLISDESDGNLDSEWLNDSYCTTNGGSLNRQIEKYLSSHPEEFEDDNLNNLSKLQRIKIKKANHDAMICLKYAAIKNRIKAKDVNDLSELIKFKNYNTSDIKKLFDRFGINIDIYEIENDLSKVGII